MFLRINTGSVQLSPQELRQALHPGEFSRFVDARSASSLQLQKALGLKKPDFRMRDAELLLRFLAYKNFIQDYRGNLKEFLDVTTKRINNDWVRREGLVEAQCREMERAFDFAEDIFGFSDYLRKWNGDAYERQKNRAVFDIMLYYFSDPATRVALQGKESDVVAEFKRLCSEDEDFLSSIESTTKSMDANRIRFNFWGKALKKISGLDIRLPFEG